MSFDLRPVPLFDVRELCAQYHGWERVAIPGKKWRSGNPAFKYERRVA